MKFAHCFFCFGLLLSQCIAEHRIFFGVGGGLVHASNLSGSWGDMGDYVDPIILPPGTQRWVVASQADKDRAAAVSAWAGCRIWKTLCVEAQGMTSGTLSRNIQYNEQLPPRFFEPGPNFFKSREDLKIQTASLSISVEFPIRHGISIFGKTGYRWTKTRIHETYHFVKILAPKYFDYSDTEGGFSWEAGLRYKIARWCSAELAWSPLTAKTKEKDFKLGYTKLGLNFSM